MYLIVDRVEWDKVVCQDLETEEEFIYSMRDMPSDVRENDVLTLVNNVFKVDVQKTKERKEMIKNLLKGLF